MSEQANDFAKRFKSAVESNFDRSVGLYERFEERTRLFEDVARRLCDISGLGRRTARILDVGCGTGISTEAISKAIPAARELCGIDLSEAMLARARSRFAGRAGVSFVKGDAERLSDFYRAPFDAVFYTASIFLIPDFSRSVEQACALLSPGGSLLISFYEGFFDAEGRDAIARTFPDMPYRFGAVRLADLMECLERNPGFTTSTVDYRREIDKGFLVDFLSIPAQSAGLFPKVNYEERIPLIVDLAEKLTAAVDPLFMGWKFIISRKS